MEATKRKEDMHSLNGTGSSTQIEVMEKTKTESIGTGSQIDKIISKSSDERNPIIEHDLDATRPQNEQDEPEYPGVFAAVLIVVSLFTTVFLVALDQTFIGTAIPKITDQFHSVEDVGWYGSAYFLTSTSLQPTCGRIYKILNVIVPLHSRAYLGAAILTLL